MTDINVANGFILRQQTSQFSNADSGKKISDGFMQSLRQTGSKITDMGSSSGKTAAKPVKVSGTNNQDSSAINSTDAENTASVSKTDINGSSEKSEINSEPAVNGGSVKVDEEAVKELEQLKDIKRPESGETEKASEETNDEALSQAAGSFSRENENTVTKNLLQQAEEALENAILKAFKELNDPEKNREEFEEKLLLFLMKLVDGINGKTDTDSPFGSDKDEDEENLGGALMQIIENMLENAEKNAEMSGEASAQTQASFVGDYVLNLNETVETEGSENPVGFPAKETNNKLYPEQFDFDRHGKVGTDPVIPPIHTHSSDNITVRTETVAQVNIDAHTVSNIQTNDFAWQSVAPSHTVEAETESGVFPAVNGFRSLGNISGTALQTEEFISAAEQVMPIGENQSESALSGDNAYLSEADMSLSSAGTSDISENFDFSAGNNANAEKNLFHSVSETVLPQSVEEPVAEPRQTETEQISVREVQVSEIQVDEAENEMYEQIALTVYNDAKRNLKAAREDESASISVKEADLSDEKTEEASESEFDELARLFGVKKKESSLAEGESEEADAYFGNAKEEKSDAKSDNGEEDISFSDVKLVSSKPIEAPIPRTLPIGGAVNRVVTQVVNQILANLPEKGQETTLLVTLNPETMGRISIKLVENAGKLSVTISADNKETAAILASRAENVQESMRDQGTQLEKYQVVYSAEQDGRAEQQNYEGSSKNPYVRNIEEDGDDDGEFEKVLQSAV